MDLGGRTIQRPQDYNSASDSSSSDTDEHLHDPAAPAPGRSATDAARGPAIVLGNAGSAFPRSGQALLSAMDEQDVSLEKNADQHIGLMRYMCDDVDDEEEDDGGYGEYIPVSGDLPPSGASRSGSKTQIPFMDSGRAETTQGHNGGPGMIHRYAMHRVISAEIIAGTRIPWAPRATPQVAPKEHHPPAQPSQSKSKATIVEQKKLSSALQHKKNPAGKTALTRERRLELLRERRARRDAKSRRQIDRQVAAQARRTETAYDRNALQYSGWGVDHGYTGVAFSGARIGSSGKAGEKNSINDTDKKKKKVRRSLQELDEIEKKIAAEMQKSYDALRQMREGTDKSALEPEAGANVEARRILVVSFRLPFKLAREESSWVASAWKNEHFDSQLMDQSAYPCTWVGWPGTEVDVGEQDHIRDSLVVNRDYVPVFVPERITDLCYSGFCKQVLWPLMHSRALTTAFHIKTNAEDADVRTMGHRVGASPSFNKGTASAESGIAFANVNLGTSSSSTLMSTPEDKTDSSIDSIPQPNSSALNPPSSSHPSLQDNYSQSQQMVDMWAAYVQVAQAFAETIREVYEEGDMIWVHGYHLMLLPNLVRQMIPGASISFSLHLPFPTSEIFRVLPWRQNILEGILAADIIGFQTFHYSRHFVRACTRVLGIDSKPLEVKYRGHLARLLICPVGVDLRRISVLQRRRAVRDRRVVLKSRFERRFVIVGLDRCVQTSGIVQKLMAFEEFLISNPKLCDNVLLVQIVLPTNPKLISRENRNLRARIDQIVSRCNARFARLTSSQKPIYCLHQALASNDLCALYETADAVLVTPTTEGMNLVPFEYLVCRENRGVPGTVIVSEFAGCASSLSGAFIVNPASTDDMALSIAEALTMDGDERRERHACMISAATRFSAANWLHTNTELLERVMTMRNEGPSVGADLETLPPNALVSAMLTNRRLLPGGARLLKEEDGKSGVTGGAATKLDEVSTAKITESEGGNLALVQNKIRDFSTKIHLVVIDFEGVLVAAQTMAELVSLPPGLRANLMKLCTSENIKVLILSKRPRHVIAKILEGVPCWIAAEHGYVLRPGWPEDGQEEQWKEWIVVPSDAGNIDNQAWLDVCGQIFSHYGRRTPGAMLETTPVSISLHMEDADREYAASIARQLLSTLSETIGGLPIKAHMGHNSVDVIHVAVDKGSAVAFAIDHLRQLIGLEEDGGTSFASASDPKREREDDPNAADAIAVNAAANDDDAVIASPHLHTTSNTGNSNDDEANIEQGKPSTFVQQELSTILCVLTGRESTDENVFSVLRGMCDVVTLSGDSLIAKPADGLFAVTNTPRSSSGMDNLGPEVTPTSHDPICTPRSSSGMDDMEKPNIQQASAYHDNNSISESVSTTLFDENISHSPLTNGKAELNCVSPGQKPMAVLCTMRTQATALTTGATFSLQNMKEVHDIIEALSGSLAN